MRGEASPPLATRRGTARRALIVTWVIALACALTPMAARATRSTPSLENMVRYLQNDQNADGGFGGEPGEASSSGFSAWATLALAAAGVNPRSQAKPGAENAFSYLTEHAGEMGPTTDFERELLVVDATGTSPDDFGGIDLVASILGREIPEPAQDGVAFPYEAGSRTAGMNDTIFAVLSLSVVHEAAAEAAVQQGATWIEHEQNKDGSWPSTCPRTVVGCSPLGREPEGEADMTAAAIEALNAAGRHKSAAQAKALEYLRETQNPKEGGFAERLGGDASNQSSSIEANAGSTAWVVQAIWAAGENPEDWKPAGVDPLTYIESMQQPDGHISWKRSEDFNGVWMTAYSGPALAGVPLPIPAPPYTPPPPPGADAPGSGGEGTQSGNGVTAGGGGAGANELFTRPQPQSTGEEPGGRRVLASRNRRKPPQSRHRRNPGPPRRNTTTIRPDAANVESAHSARASGASVGENQRGSDTGAGQTRRGLALAVSTPSATASTSAQAREVTGVPIGSPLVGRHANEPAAPGLRGAGRGTGSAALAIGIAAVAFALALSGAALERSRPLVLP